MALLTTILIVLLIYYGFKILFRYFGPTLISYITKKAGENFQRRFEQQQNYRQNPVDGEVTIDKKSKKTSTNSKVGEYVDFEEID